MGVSKGVLQTQKRETVEITYGHRRHQQQASIRGAKALRRGAQPSADDDQNSSRFFFFFFF
eukprot:5766303-Amphidinium_carterae.1